MRSQLALFAIILLVIGTNASFDSAYQKWKSFMFNEHTAPSSSDEQTKTTSDNDAADEGEQQARASPSLGTLIRSGLSDWLSFKGLHAKSFSNEETENAHMISFIKAKQHVDTHNSAFERGKTSFKIGINHLADLPYDEYKQLNGYRHSLLGASGDAAVSVNATTRWLEPLNARVPDAVDWRDKGYVTEVKNQGMCGSCYSYSATGSLEGQHMRRTGKLVSLSEQNIVDCSTAFGNNGCNGGLMDFAFEYIKQNHGIDTEKSYPYKGRQGKCRFRKAEVGAEDIGFTDLPEDDEEALKTAIATQGPVSVAIDAGHRSFQLYRSGVYYERNCSPKNLDHGVLAVGYGTDPEHGDYWIVKNSWGEEWGENGYVRMARNKKNHCGIASKASYPLV